MLSLCIWFYFSLAKPLTARLNLKEKNVYNPIPRRTRRSYLVKHPDIGLVHILDTNFFFLHPDNKKKRLKNTGTNESKEELSFVLLFC